MKRMDDDILVKSIYRAEFNGGHRGIRHKGSLKKLVKHGGSNFQESEDELGIRENEK